MNRRDYIKKVGVTLMGTPFLLNYYHNIPDGQMKNNNFDIIIIGGSYAGLSAALALGRALRKVLIIDSGLACNRFTPHAHNMLTRDGQQPEAIRAIGKEQVLHYDTIKLLDDLATSGEKLGDHFMIKTAQGKEFQAKKLIFATGLKDLMPSLEGFRECWGKTILHCPYCHGYEVKNEVTGILANGEVAYHYAKLISNWTPKLTVFTNGPSTLTATQHDKLAQYNIDLVEQEVAFLEQEEGQLKRLHCTDSTSYALRAIYARPDFEQHCTIPQMLGCELNENGLYKVNMFQQATVDDIYCCGDNASPLRSVSYAIATGNIAGVMANNDLIEAAF